MGRQGTYSRGRKFVFPDPRSARSAAAVQHITTGLPERQKEALAKDGPAPVFCEGMEELTGTPDSTKQSQTSIVMLSPPARQVAASKPAPKASAHVQSDNHWFLRGADNNCERLHATADVSKGTTPLRPVRVDNHRFSRGLENNCERVRAVRGIGNIAATRPLRSSRARDTERLMSRTELNGIQIQTDIHVESRDRPDVVPRKSGAVSKARSWYSTGS
jgi:hypothetical protein